MAAEAEVLDELHRLRARVPQLTGALAASVDGLLLAQDTSGVEPEGVAALTASVLGVAVRMADATGQGGFRELLVRGANGYVATYAAGSAAVLTLLAEDRINVGRLHLEGRRAGIRIGELVDAAAARADPPTRTAGAGTRAGARTGTRTGSRTGTGTRAAIADGTADATADGTGAGAGAGTRATPARTKAGSPTAGTAGTAATAPATPAPNPSPTDPPTPAKTSTTNTTNTTDTRSATPRTRPARTTTHASPKKTPTTPTPSES
ncbi:roadblock/LC7 domain-containing protein [Streptomyces poonensis]|uniref:Roadblock/LAMTOR2 domain-containing protein n=1 Tax=Streptomyces poonensis TaxID=68255 RepID=A0A918PND5_9ACTN|nr:hypothetical protein GCM10010365_41030 [Streptomyces poonensis]GLJ92499.1 hypothetical protein GCM10017589_51080 [Streptomyces poonensis]